MKKLLLTLSLILLFSMSWGTGIVDRTATRDTLSLPFQFLDSLGEAVDGAANDSVFIVVHSPGGVEVFRDSMAYDDGSITSSAWEDFAGGNHYTYNERVSVLDGSSSSEGVFSYQLVAWDNSLSLITRYAGDFQIVAISLDDALDSTVSALGDDELAVKITSYLGPTGDFSDYGDSTTNKPFGYWLNIAGDTADVWVGLDDILLPFTLDSNTTAITKYNADADSIFVVNGATGASDTTHIIIYFHPSGVSGQRPDSVKCIQAP